MSKEPTPSAMIMAAEAQLLGFFHAKNGDGLLSLIESMGLTNAEWEIMKKEHSLVYLDDDDLKEINDYFRPNPWKKITTAEAKEVCKKALKSHDKAWDAREEAWEVVLRARAALDKAERIS